ncbi:hypothetical protein D3C87_21050 [compost metagenome]
MIQTTIYEKNKPLFNSLLTGAFYFFLCWSVDFENMTKGLLVALMLLLPGLTFPLATCYFGNHSKNSEIRNLLHAILSIAIYHGCAWLFSGEGQVKYITILAGFLGSLFFLLSTRYILKKQIDLIHILLTSVLSGLAFLPYELIGHFGYLIGLAIFLWTIFNGSLLNFAYKRKRFPLKEAR